MTQERGFHMKDWKERGDQRRVSGRFAEERAHEELEEGTVLKERGNQQPRVSKTRSNRIAFESTKERTWTRRLTSQISP